MCQPPSSQSDVESAGDGIDFVEVYKGRNVGEKSLPIGGDLASSGLQLEVLDTSHVLEGEDVTSSLTSPDEEPPSDLSSQPLLGLGPAHVSHLPPRTERSWPGSHSRTGGVVMDPLLWRSARPHRLQLDVLRSGWRLGNLNYLLFLLRPRKLPVSDDVCLVLRVMSYLALPTVQVRDLLWRPWRLCLTWEYLRPKSDLRGHGERSRLERRQ